MTTSRNTTDDTKVTCAKCDRQYAPTKLGLVRRHRDAQTQADCFGSECFSKEWFQS